MESLVSIESVAISTVAFGLYEEGIKETIQNWTDLHRAPSSEHELLCCLLLYIRLNLIDVSGKISPSAQDVCIQWNNLCRTRKTMHITYIHSKLRMVVNDIAQHVGLTGLGGKKLCIDIQISTHNLSGHATDRTSFRCHAKNLICSFAFWHLSKHLKTERSFLWCFTWNRKNNRLSRTCFLPSVRQLSYCNASSWKLKSMYCRSRFVTLKSPFITTQHSRCLHWFYQQKFPILLHVEDFPRPVIMPSHSRKKYVCSLCRERNPNWPPCALMINRFSCIPVYHFQSCSASLASPSVLSWRLPGRRPPLFQHLILHKLSTACISFAVTAELLTTFIACLEFCSVTHSQLRLQTVRKYCWTYWTAVCSCHACVRWNAMRDRLRTSIFCATASPRSIREKFKQVTSGNKYRQFLIWH